MYFRVVLALLFTFVISSHAIPVAISWPSIMNSASATGGGTVWTNVENFTDGQAAILTIGSGDSQELRGLFSVSSAVSEVYSPTDTFSGVTFSMFYNTDNGTAVWATKQLRITTPTYGNFGEDKSALPIEDTIDEEDIREFQAGGPTDKWNNAVIPVSYATDGFGCRLRVKKDSGAGNSVFSVFNMTFFFHGVINMEVNSIEPSSSIGFDGGATVVINGVNMYPEAGLARARFVAAGSTYEVPCEWLVAPHNITCTTPAIASFTSGITTVVTVSIDSGETWSTQLLYYTFLPVGTTGTTTGITSSTSASGGSGSTQTSLPGDTTSSSNTLNDDRQSSLKEGGSGAGVGIGLGIGAFVLLLVGGIIAFIVLRRRGGGNLTRRSTIRRQPFKADLKSLTFRDYLQANNPSGSATKEKIAQLSELLLEPEIVLMSTIAVTTDVTEQDKAAKNIVFLAEAQGASLNLICKTITVEILKEKSEGTLFRQNSMSSKMFRVYSEMVGLEYLHNNLGYIINELMDKEAEGEMVDAERGQSLIGGSLELDPTKMSDQDDHSVNKLALQLICQKIVSGLLKSVDKIPNALRQIFHHLYTEVRKQYSEDAARKTVGGFFFLRFMNPAIVAPHLYGISSRAPGTSTQRILILVTKVLQNLSNAMVFGNKESFMLSMNDFIADNLDKTKKFFDSISQPVSATPAPIEIPKNVKQNAVINLHTFLVNNFKGALAEGIPPEMATQIKEIIH